MNFKLEFPHNLEPSKFKVVSDINIIIRDTIELDAETNAETYPFHDEYINAIPLRKLVKILEDTHPEIELILEHDTYNSEDVEIEIIGIIKKDEEEYKRELREYEEKEKIKNSLQNEYYEKLKLVSALMEKLNNNSINAEQLSEFLKGME